MILGRRPRRQLRPLFYGQKGRVGERAEMSLDPAAISGCRRAGRVRPRGTRATPSCCRREVRLTLDDVVNLDYLWWTGKLDSALAEDRHQALTEGLELLL